ncbi:Uncharacterised protein [Mycolicibacterium vanbaalenii]|uniref:Uncharacterized protein n=1 Tax=Mycolicibacterium vanbaalenii TaxID=110539 RepID=A0A5S9R296_MYCVN|nr:hypothetical protein [Mycolicibacterium vanbaalenii]CAA0126022.1 Uncharacterised protein [Mycolicibacterium vanbaalenii]
MEQNIPPTGTRPKRKPLRGTLVTAGVVLAILVLAAAAIYAVAFLALAPMMQ